MKIRIVAVFCAYVAAAFSEEFNSSILNQLSGKSLPPPMNVLVVTKNILRKLPTVAIANKHANPMCLGVLLSRRVVAFSGGCWSTGAGMVAIVHCHDPPLYPSINIALEMPVPSQERLTEGDSIVEIKLKSEVSETCWPPEQERFTEIVDQPVVGAPTFGIDVFIWELNVFSCNEPEIFMNKMSLIETFDDDFIQVKKAKGSPLIGAEVIGEPIFMGNKIAGLYIPYIFNMNPYKYTRLRKKKNPSIHTSATSSQ